MRQLLEHKCDLDIADWENVSPASLAAENSSWENLELLMDAGNIDVDRQPKNSWLWEAPDIILTLACEP